MHLAALFAAFAFLISFVLYWAGKGTAPLDARGFELIGFILVAIELMFGYQAHWGRGNGRTNQG